MQKWKKQLCTATVTTNNTVHHLRDGIPWSTLLLLVYETATTGINKLLEKWHGRRHRQSLLDIRFAEVLTRHQDPAVPDKNVPTYINGQT